ncbi:SWIB/MDM2 domain-containing protein [Chiua virens]|nr:SWIB/MDM2 domain-containing protein [Chiua virens]
MSLDLAALEEPIIRILTAPGTDLSTISAKRVRKTLLEDPAYGFLGLTAEVLKAQRTDVDQLISRIFEDVNRAASTGSKRKHEGEDEAGEDVGDGEAEAEDDGEEDTAGMSKTPKKKKSKKSVEESDAALARKLSSEINSRSRRGAPMAAGAPSPRKAKRKPKKSPETVDLDDEDEDGNKPKKRGTAKGGFAKEYVLSAPLSAVLAIEKLSRPQVVKKLWEYIRQHELQNPSNKKEIVCDDALRAVFAVDKIDMFKMNKVLGQHLHEE